MITIKKEIKNISLSAIFSALIVVIILLGTFVEMIDITAAAICSVAVCVILMEAKKKYAFLVFLTSSVLCMIFAPLSTATLYFIGFFGYYPIIRQLIAKLPKFIRKIISFSVFNTSMILLLLVFKAVFAMTEEPVYMYFLLIAVLNLFFFSFDYFMDIFPIIYIKKIRTKIKFR